MELSGRERRTVVLGAGAALLVALVTWVILPLHRSWSRMGDELSPKLEAVEKVRERLGRRQALLARRARLVRQMGALVPPEKGASGSPAAKPPQNPPQDSQNSPPAAAPESEGPKPVRTGFEAELEKAAQKAKVKLESLVAEKVARSADLKCFELTALRVEVEAKPDALVALLHALEKGRRFVRVDELTIRRDVSKPGPLQATFCVAAYESMSVR